MLGLATVAVASACGTAAAPEAAPTTEQVEVEALVDAVTDGASVLLEAPAVATGAVGRSPDGEVDHLRWVLRVDEDTYTFVRARRSEGGELAGSDETIPPHVETTARVVTEDGVAGADQGPPGSRDGQWVVDLERARPAWSDDAADNPLPLAAGDVLDVEEHDVAASVLRDGDGEATWTATWEDPDRSLTLTHSWTIASAGHLAEHRREFASSSDGTFVEEVRYEPQSAVPDITLPAEGDPLDLDRLGVWPDLPRPEATGPDHSD